MKRLLLVCVLVATCLLSFSPLVIAQSSSAVKVDPSSKPIDPCDGVSNGVVCSELKQTGDPINGNDGILTKVANAFALITGVISVFMITIGGLRYILSSGDSSKTASAKNTIMYAAIGLAVAITAKGIVQFILTRI